MGNCCWGSASVDNLSQDILKADIGGVALSPPRIVESSGNGPSTRRINDDVASKRRMPTEVGSSRGSVGGGLGDGGSGSGSGGRERAKSIVPNLKAFTMGELRSATRNFRPDTMLGEGGFGKVFKGWVEEKTYAPSRVGIGIPIAVKKSSPDSPQGLQEWQAEVKFLGKFSHPNLVKLLGYCVDDKLFLLVYEYMKKGSLEIHLFKKGMERLPWDVRLKIAIGAARGLAFLHNSEKSVIYRDFKASNILLDDEFNAKISDFGLAKFGPPVGSSHVTTRIIGTYGYAAPEYIATGHLYIKSDVYGFGVVLLELLTGLPALDQNRPSGCHNLAEWAKPSLSDKKRLKKLIDPRLENQYPLEGAVLVAELITRCLLSDQNKRPSMQEVLNGLERVNLIKHKPKTSRIAKDQPTTHVSNSRP